ncbi:MAG: hypothetical protein M1299_07495 [Firmicutes bacterium]|nr:hypothetical protein [Bacillota bacterium]
MSIAHSVKVLVGWVRGVEKALSEDERLDILAEAKPGPLSTGTTIY